MPPFTPERVTALWVLQSRRGHINSDHDVVTRPEAGTLDELHHHVQGIAPAGQSRADAAFICQQGRQTSRARLLGGGIAHTRQQMDGVRHGRGICRHGQKVLDIHTSASMQPPAQNIHHGNGHAQGWLSRNGLHPFKQGLTQGSSAGSGCGN